MTDLAQIEIERDLADAAARRAAKEGLTLTAYLSLLLRRTFERNPGEENVLVYNHVGDRGEFQIDPDLDENEDSLRRRSELYHNLFGRRD
jgi:hypothetical protein